MKQGILFILLLCTTLLNAQAKDVKAWQEIDRLIEKEHYTSAYAQSERLLNEAKCKGDGQAMLLAAIRMGEAAEGYQEEPLSHACDKMCDQEQQFFVQYLQDA